MKVSLSWLKEYVEVKLSPEELAAAGVSEDLVRLSIGIESAEHILQVIDAGLQAV